MAWPAAGAFGLIAILLISTWGVRRWRRRVTDPISSRWLSEHGYDKGGDHRWR